MKTLSILCFALFLSVSSFGRVRSVPPESGYKVLNSVVVDSVLIVRFLVFFEGKSRVVVVREDCNCVVTRNVAVALFWYTEFEYVKPREVDEVYTEIS